MTQEPHLEPHFDEEPHFDVIPDVVPLNEDMEFFAEMRQMEADRRMSVKRWILIAGLVALFVFAKAWVFAHPKSATAIVLGALLLIVSEPAEAK